MKKTEETISHFLGQCQESEREIFSGLLPLCLRHLRQPTNNYYCHLCNLQKASYCARSTGSYWSDLKPISFCFGSFTIGDNISASGHFIIPPHSTYHFTPNFPIDFPVSSSWRVATPQRLAKHLHAVLLWAIQVQPLSKKSNICGYGNIWDDVNPF